MIITWKLKDHALRGAIASLIALLWATASSGALASSWQLSVTDTLVKMDIKAMDREFSRQFSGSALAEAQVSTDHQIKRKAETIGSLRKAIEQATTDGARRKLRIREIDERAGLIASLEQRTDLRLEKAQAEMAAYSEIWSRIKRSNHALSAEDRQFISAQKSAIKRMQNISASIDALPLQAEQADSGYTREYTLMAYDMARLQEAINRHAANTTRQAATIPLTKSEYITQKLVAAQGELALALEEKKLTGLMAKMLALDATALQDDIEPASGDGPGTTLAAGHADHVVDLFLP